MVFHVTLTIIIFTCFWALPALPGDWLLASLKFQIVTQTNLWPESSGVPHVDLHPDFSALCYLAWTAGSFVPNRPVIRQWQLRGNSVSHWLMHFCTRIFSQPYISSFFFPSAGFPSVYLLLPLWLLPATAADRQQSSVKLTCLRTCSRKWTKIIRRKD